jgi:16S rRNA (cytosine967-C5)-methyltransferase
MTKSSRQAAIEILSQWESSAKTIDQLQQEWLKKNQLSDQRDSQLLMAIIYGIIRKRSFIDTCLAKFSKHPLRKMKPLTLAGLRVGLFQIISMDRVPDSAAVNETIKALKNLGQPKWLTGFVNAILRNIIRNKKKVTSIDYQKSLSEHIRLEHPEFLIKRWQDRYGKQTATDICNFNNQQPPLCLRLVPENFPVLAEHESKKDFFLQCLAELSIKAEPGKYLDTAVILPDFKGSISELPGYGEGYFQVQDEAAQLVTMMLAPFETGEYLDCCAGLGGKATHLAQLLDSKSSLTAVDPNSHRIRLLQENLERLKLLKNVKIAQMDIASFQTAENQKTFSRILVDAPCSGIGVIRRHPEIRWKRKKRDFKRYRNMQLSILKEAARLLNNNGILVYATCTIEPEETSFVIESFLETHQDFSLTAPLGLPLKAQELLDKNYFFSIPGCSGLDGFFAACLKRKN